MDWNMILKMSVSVLLYVLLTALLPASSAARNGCLLADVLDVVKG